MTPTVSYFNVQRFCLHDGPGIRTTLFMKGCPAKCVWCHNPEGQSAARELIFRADRCTSCGKCIGICAARSVSDGKIVIDREKCTLCGKCTEVCLSDCSEVCGKTASASEVYEFLIRDRRYFEESGGGITFSGGEPLSQPGALLYMARRASSAGISFAVEPSGSGDLQVLKELASLGALFLFDIKGVDETLHIKNTGISNAKPLSNLDALASIGADIVLRLPLVPGFNDSASDLDALSHLLSSLRGRVRHAEIMPFHRIGIGKGALIGRGESAVADTPDGRESAPRWLDALERSGVKIIIG